VATAASLGLAILLGLSRSLALAALLDRNTSESRVDVLAATVPGGLVACRNKIQT